MLAWNGVRGKKVPGSNLRNERTETLLDVADHIDLPSRSTCRFHSRPLDGIDVGYPALLMPSLSPKFHFFLRHSGATVKVWLPCPVKVSQSFFR
ncbi:hypothetical protein FEM48_Zijuj05G0030100 [Ziziphus jujuba var. spinosa]|uniref:Uncharacterized protein n=1 Tax=Ziziphus jujuba var. spinosa TaxID=714518 RepID=A0A978VCF6_ZIZJJ|nr:hypothetical protein FEM48_Zijuj05G0030100 [Ziziphus jujuba var. spinosa]